MHTPTPSFRTLNYRTFAALVLVSLLLLPLGGSASQVRLSVVSRPAVLGPNTLDVIVQGNDLTTVVSLVREVGGMVTRELGDINAVGTELTLAQLAALQEMDGILRIYSGRSG